MSDRELAGTAGESSVPNPQPPAARRPSPHQTP